MSLFKFIQGWTLQFLSEAEFVEMAKVSLYEVQLVEMAKLYNESNPGDTTYFNALSHEFLMGMIHDLLVSSSGWCVHI